MKPTIVLGLIAASLAAYSLASAFAETPRPAALVVKTSDLNLDSAEGVDRLALRFTRKINAICGHPTQAGLTFANTGGGLEERAACKAALKVQPDAHPGIREAFAIAIARP